MIDVQKQKAVLALPPQLKDDGDFAGNAYVDTSGWGHVRFLLAVGTLDAAIGSTAEGNAPKVEECDTPGGSYSDVAGAVLADAIADDEDDSFFAIDVDLRKAHKRYMRVNAPHAGDGAVGANLCIIAILSDPQIAPDSATEQGLAEHISA